MAFRILRTKAPCFSIVCGEPVDEELSIEAYYLKRKIETGKNLGIKNSILRKISSITLVDKLYEETYAEVSFKNLTLSEAEHRVFSKGFSWKVHLGYWDFFGFTRSEECVMNGVVKEHHYSYEDSGISVTVNIVSPGIIKMDEFITLLNPPLTGEEKTMEEALNKLAKYCGFKQFYYNVTNLDIKNWETKKAKVDRPWDMIPSQKTAADKFKAITARDVITRLAEDFGQTWRVRNNCLYFGTWSKDEPSIAIVAKTAKFFNYRSLWKKVAPSQIFTHTNEDTFKAFELIDKTTQGTTNYVVAKMDPITKDIKQDSKQITKDYNTNTLISLNKGATYKDGEALNIGTVDENLAETQEKIEKTKNAIVQDITDKTSLLNPSMVTDGSTSPEQQKAQLSGNYDKNVKRVSGGRITGAELDTSFRSGQYFYFSGIQEHTGTYLAEEVTMRWEAGGLAEMEIVGTKKNDVTSKTDKKVEEAIVKANVEKKKILEDTINDSFVATHSNDSTILYREETIKAQMPK